MVFSHFRCTDTQDIESIAITQSIFEFYDARAFYRGVIKENLKDFYQDPTNTRKAINACITLYHLADWYWVNDKNKREKQKEIPHSLALSDIANGSKHFNPQKCYQSGKVEGTDIRFRGNYKLTGVDS